MNFEVPLCCTHTHTHLTLPTQLERLKQKEFQAQQMEEQRQQFKLKTQNLLKFHGEVSEPKPARVGRKKKGKSGAGDIYSEGEDGGGGEAGGSQPPARKKRCVYQ